MCYNCHDELVKDGWTPPVEELIAELSLALETCDSCNKTGVRWAQDSPFAAKINDLLARAGRREST